MCGTIQPDVVIFNDTIENNIRIGCLTMTDAQIYAAADLVGIHGFIESLPDGYTTRIGSEGGIQLTNAQKHRIAIARVLAREPAILIVDEDDAPETGNEWAFEVREFHFIHF